MPVKHVVTSNGTPGYRWGAEGKFYSYAPGDEDSRRRARAKAERQGRAIEAARAALAGKNLRSGDRS